MHKLFFCLFFTNALLDAIVSCHNYAKTGFKRQYLMILNMYLPQNEVKEVLKSDFVVVVLKH